MLRVDVASSKSLTINRNLNLRRVSPTPHGWAAMCGVGEGSSWQDRQQQLFSTGSASQAALMAFVMAAVMVGSAIGVAVDDDVDVDWRFAAACMDISQ